VIIAPTGPQTILSESPLFVTISVEVVKLKEAAVEPAVKPKEAKR